MLPLRFPFGLVVIVAVVLVSTGSAHAGYKNCGEVRTSPNATKILKVQKLGCPKGKRVARAFERKAFSETSCCAAPGDTYRVLRFFRCRFVTYFDPYETAYKCRDTRRPKFRIRALYPPERKPI